MRQIDGNELKTWSLGGNIAEPVPNFVIVKTPGCFKCQALINKKEVLKDLENSVAYYEFKPGDNNGASVISQLNVTSVPLIIFRYKEERDENSKWLISSYIPDYNDGFIETENFFDAIRDKDYTFFGFDEFDNFTESKDKEKMIAALPYNRLLRTMYGEISYETLKEKEAFIKNLN